MKIIIILIAITLSGCAGSIKEYRDTDYTIGCVAVEANTKLGYFNQEGAAEICKLKCSPDLPANFYYKYDNIRTGCHIENGNN